ncbi:MAG: cytidylate kinase family protein [Clostridia bacterium]|nr:cytidylate kinase family protein [Clostridia bacterium]
MNEIKNKIITVSGEPVSGKSTVVKRLKEKYEAMGYTVHVILTGHFFRDIIMEEYFKMYPDRKDANLADVQADETFAHKRNEIDKLVDEEMRKKGIEINSKERPNDVYIIDSRLAWHNIPHSYAVRLTIDESMAGKRAFADETRGPEDSYKTVEEAIRKTRERKLGEIERYKERYGVDLSDPENYDLIVDTAYSNTNELADIIIEGEKSYRQGQYYPKRWASPASFIGTQSDRATAGPSGMYRCTPEELAAIMREEGYDPEKGEIEILENYGQKFVKDGHHTCMATLIIGKTLVPYIVDKDEGSNARMQAEQNNINFAYDWSDCIRYYGGKIGNHSQFKDFSIEKLTSYESRIKGMLEKLQGNNSGDGR